MSHHGNNLFEDFKQEDWDKLKKQMDGANNDLSEKELIKNTKLIAEFNGWREAPIKSTVGAENNWVNNNHPMRWNNFKLSEMRYHSSWDWLMPVVEKIESLAIDEIGEPYFVIMPHQCDVRKGKNVILSTRKTSSKIEMVWLAVVDFIKWHNENNP